jgi:hypothetical protein
MDRMDSSCGWGVPSSLKCLAVSDDKPCRRSCIMQSHSPLTTQSNNLLPNLPPHTPTPRPNLAAAVGAARLRRLDAAQPHGRGHNRRRGGRRQLLGRQQLPVDDRGAGAALHRPLFLAV